MLTRTLSLSSMQTKLKDVAGKGEKERKVRKEAEDTDSAESDLLAQLANSVMKDEKRRVKESVKPRKKGGKAKKKISE